MEANLTVSFPLGNLKENFERSEIYQKLYKEITKSLCEDEVQGVQLYPAGWPRKVQITVKSKETKEKLVIEGMEIFGQHFEIKDEGNDMTKVVLKDIPIECSDELVHDIMRDYGEVVRIEKEMIYVDGRKTTWTTGTRFVYFSDLVVSVPQKLTFSYFRKQMTISAWYRGQNTATNTRCTKCGSESHNVAKCEFESRVCFRCQHPGHSQKDCPQNDGTRQSEETIIFLSGKSVFSNFNMDCPFEIDNERYICTEQYIQSQKCKLFNDTEHDMLIMNSTDPKEMKRLGENVRNYVHRTWMENCHDIAMKCNRVKFETHEHAKKQLLQTGNKVLGEGTMSKKWGIGIHISDPRSVLMDEWSGENLMGSILSQIRDEMRKGNEEVAGSSADVPAERMKNKESENIDFKMRPSNISNEEQIQENLPEIIQDDSEDASDTFPIAVFDQKKKSVALIIGDSNTNGLEIGDERFPVDIHLCAKSGLKVSEIEEKVGECELDPEEVSVAVIHVGTCSWKAGGSLYVQSANSVYYEYVDALNTVSTKYPKAELVISSILPRVVRNRSMKKQKKATEINREAGELNKMLKELSQKEQNITYVDNDEAFKAEGKAYTEAFSENDATGVHLNQRGKMMLADNLRAAISEAHYKNSLLVEWDIVVPLKV